MKTDVSYKDTLFLLWHCLWWWWWGVPLNFAPFSLFFHFSCCSHYNMMPLLSSSRDHSSFRQKKLFLCPNSFHFWESVCETEPLPHPPVSSLTIIKVPLSKELNPPLLCICSVVSRQDFGCSRQTPR